MNNGECYNNMIYGVVLWMFKSYRKRKYITRNKKKNIFSFLTKYDIYNKDSLLANKKVKRCYELIPYQQR